ncbi:MAG: amino acid adenylation domain-containing protein [Pseudomonadota bacterium]
MLQRRTEDNIEDILALTPVQRGMVFETLANPSCGIYTGLFHAELPEGIDIARFKAAWRYAIKRHPALRTIIQPAHQDGPVQIVLKNLPDNIWHDELLANQSVCKRLDEIHSLPVDFDHAPALRLYLLNEESGRQWFAWASHHALVDDWSAVAILREVDELYRNGVIDEASEALPFSAFVKWQAAQDLTAAEQYWREKIGDFQTPSAPQLPRLETRKDYRPAYKSIEATLSEAATTRLTETAKSLRVTLAPLMTAAWSIVLHRLSAQDDVMFGLAVTQRPPEIAGIHSAVGNFVTVVPARTQLNTTTDIKTLILSQASDAFDAIEHSLVPLNRLHEISGLPRDETLFDTVLSMESAWASPFSLNDSGSLFSNLSARDRSHYPMAILIAPGARLSARLQYDGARYSDASAQFVLSMLTIALQALPDYINRSPFDLPVSRPQAKQTPDGLAPTLQHSKAFVYEAFRTCAKENPNTPALITDDVTLDYETLDQQSDAWAQQLINRELGPGDRIAIVMERSINAIIAIFATFKAGCTYVPIDPKNPPERLARLLEDCNASLIFTEDKHVSSLGDYARLAVTMGCEPPAAQERLEPIRPPGPDDTAYIIYTSGSMGAPKGVAVSHANLSYSTAARLQFYDEAPQSFLLLSPIVFDSSVAGLFWTLATGGALVLSQPGRETDVEALAHLIKRNNVTHTLGLPSLLALIAELAPREALASLRTVITAGETLSASAVSQIKSAMPQARIYNEYGPTEATVWCLAYEATDGQKGAVPIGSPIPGAVIRIRDAHSRPVPDGLPGELLVGGPGVAQGYINNEPATAQHFLIDDETPTTRFYATGDLVRRRPDGQIDFLGRADGQLKIRGHRIEPSEIEAILLERAEIREVAVNAFGEAANKHLVAYIALCEDQTISVKDLKQYAQDALPSWMRPDQFVTLDALPRTATGKVDRTALLAPDVAPEKEYIEPRTPLEKTLAEIWKQALKLECDIGARENFFDLGGNSLAAMRLLNAIEKALDEKLPFAIIGQISTIEKQAQQIKEHANGSGTDGSLMGTPAANMNSDPSAQLSNEEAAMLRSYTDSWPGKPAFDGSLFRIMNEKGKAPPLVWCFNNGHEFGRLAGQLGAKQPVYGLRSGNLVLDITPENHRENNRRVALHALPELLRILPDGPFYLGGNCQGAAIAMELALALQELGRTVLLVILMEAVPEEAFAGRVALIFGKDSIFNPYTAHHDPDNDWKRLYDQYTVDIIPGRHGTYFDRLRVGALTKAVKRALQAVRNDSSEDVEPPGTQGARSGKISIMQELKGLFRR